MSRAAARFNRSFQTSHPDRDACLRLAGENSLDRGAPGTDSSAPLSKWSVPPNTVASLPLSTPVTKPPKSQKSGSPPVIHFGDFPTKQGSPTGMPVAIPVPKSTPRFSLPPRLYRRTKSPVAKSPKSPKPPKPSQPSPFLRLVRSLT